MVINYTSQLQLRNSIGINRAKLLMHYVDKFIIVSVNHSAINNFKENRSLVKQY